jgi:hypothetical protein
LGQKIFEKAARWLIFSVTISLVPLIFTAISLASRGNSFDLIDIIGNGELLLISTALCAASVGELFGTSPKYRTLKIVLGGIAVVLLMLAALNFADISAAKTSGTQIVPDVLKATSLYIFFSSIIVSGGCIVVSEVE